MCSDLARSSATCSRPPRVSVLVPTYHYAAYLPQALDSVLAQTFDDFELLISDDASPDDSAAVIEHYAARDPRIRGVVQPRNLGMVENWNWCLRQARGEYVKFLFGDDLLARPDALAHLVSLLDTHPSATLAASARLLIDDHARVTGVADEIKPGLHPGPELIAECLRSRCNRIGEPSTVLFRRSPAQRGFDPSLRQIVDLEFWFHLLLAGDLVYTAEPLCSFRQHRRQQTAVNHRSIQPHVEILQLLARYLRDPAVQPHLRPGTFAHHQLVFRHLHYARKSTAHRRREFAAAIAQLDLDLPLPRSWKLICWLLHRITRPFQNLRRKAASWRQRLSGRPRAAATANVGFDPFPRRLSP